MATPHPSSDVDQYDPLLIKFPLQLSLPSEFRLWAIQQSLFVLQCVLLVTKRRTPFNVKFCVTNRRPPVQVFKSNPQFLTK